MHSCFKSQVTYKAETSLDMKIPSDVENIEKVDFEEWLPVPMLLSVSLDLKILTALGGSGIWSGCFFNIFGNDYVCEATYLSYFI